MFGDVSSEEGSGEQVYHLWDRGMRRVLDPASIEALVKLVAPEFAGCVDFGRAVVASRTFISELLRERESDVLVRVPFRERAASEEITICVLVEHQSSVDLEVKASERETLRQSESLFGWLLSILREDTTEKAVLREVLAEAVPEINQVPGTQVSRRREILCQSGDMNKARFYTAPWFS